MLVRPLRRLYRPPCHYRQQQQRQIHLYSRIAIRTQRRVYSSIYTRTPDIALSLRSPPAPPNTTTSLTPDPTIIKSSTSVPSTTSAISTAAPTTTITTSSTPTTTTTTTATPTTTATTSATHITPTISTFNLTATNTVRSTSTTATAIIRSARTVTLTATSPTRRNMASRSTDSDYTSFLEGASEQTTSSSTTKKQGDGQFTSKTVDDSSTIPAGIKQAIGSEDAVYVSESDEPFEAVSLAFPSDTLEADSFAEAVGLKGKTVESLSHKQFDPRDQYKAIIQAVEKATDGKKNGVNFFRVALKGSRAEYWVVGLANASSGNAKTYRLVGVKAAAVES